MFSSISFSFSFCEGGFQIQIMFSYIMNLGAWLHLVCFLLEVTCTYTCGV